MGGQRERGDTYDFALPRQEDEVAAIFSNASSQEEK